MEGLEVAIVNYSALQAENRCDSEFFRKDFLKAELFLKSKSPISIGDLFKVTDGEHGSVSFIESGVKYLTAENIKKGYIDFNNIRYVDWKTNERNKRAEVAVGDVLVSIKGTLGEVGVAEKSLLPANMNRDVAILKPLKDMNFSTYTLSAFLMCKYGNLQSIRGGSGGVQQMITLERLRQFLIPEFSSNFHSTISENYIQFLTSRSLADKFYKDAENILLKEMGIENFIPNFDNINQKNFSEIFGNTDRIDAEYYRKRALNPIAIF